MSDFETGDASHLLALVAKRYATASTYFDCGLATTNISSRLTQTVRFATAFSRPDRRFRFEAQAEGAIMGRAHVRLDSIDGRAIASLHSVMAGVPQRIPRLLEREASDEDLGRPITLLSAAKQKREVQVDGVSCICVEGKGIDDLRIEIWVGSDLLIRRVMLQSDRVGAVQETNYKPLADIPIDWSQHSFLSS